MTDDDVITLVKDQRDKVPLTIPVDAVIKRGRALRTRRLLHLTAGAVCLITGATVGIATLIPGRQQSPGPTDKPPSRAETQSPIQLAAWTVTQLPNGNISVTIHQLREPESLQRTLRADGVPASVTFQHLNPSCRAYPASAALLKRVFPEPYRHLDQLLRFPPHGPRLKPLTRTFGSPRPLPVEPPGMSANTTVIVIDPAALPHHAGVQLASSSHASLILVPGLVYIHPHCTG